MGPVKTLIALLLLMVAATGAAQTVTVQIVTDEAVPADFGSTYGLGQLNNTAYVFGPNFLIRVSYSDLTGQSLSFALAGGQQDYRLAWRVAGTTQVNPMGESLGLAVANLSGSSSGVYYRDDGTLVLLGSDATRFQLGAQATPAAIADLSAPVTLTATLQ